MKVTTMRRPMFVGSAIVALAVAVAVLIPVSSNAWPFQNPEKITVSGDLVCKGFSAAAESSYPYGRVEGFEIRGQSQVLRTSGNGYAATYEVSVPNEWKIEWSLKCNNSGWEHGSFTVDNTLIGSSDNQRRAICTDAGGLGVEPCLARNFENCVGSLLFGALVPSSLAATKPFEFVLAKMYDKWHEGGPNDLPACLKAIQLDGPQLSATPKRDDLPTPVPTIPPESLPVPIEKLTPPSDAQPATETPQPPNRTWAETAGGVSSTWTNFRNAGGSQGPSIGRGQTVQIACKLQGFAVEDGNTWWYRIASSPWNDNYYVSADAFYNNGQTGGPLKGTPYVDGSVGDC